ncbi:MAG: AMP-binding protein, partial [Acidobacteria bacterium]|nr:AMP-binding protein [Acidobacteriota bacterium]
VEVKVAGDGEILVRGENVTAGYLGAPGAAAQVLDDGWLHTGDIGFMDESGRLYIRGRKKEMIVTPAGLNVFPEDVERVVNEQPGVRDSAVVGASHGGEERVHAVLVPENGADPEEIVRRANARLEDHQKIRGFSVWTAGDLPRTEGTRKLKRGEIRHWVTTGAAPHAAGTKEAGVRSVLARYAGARPLGPETTLDQLGLSSLERVELMLELERRFGAAVDESALAGGSSIADLERRMEEPQARAPEPAEPLVFPSWNRSRWARAVRRLNPLWVFILARLFVWVKAEGLENLSGIEPPVIFAPNHQSHFDMPAILLALPAKWRYRVAPAMSKEWFDAHFHPERHTWREWFTNSLNYYLAALFMNAFPIPRREAGARETLRYAGELANEGWCVLIFAEGRFTQHGEIQPFQPGVGMLASRLAMPVVPVRLTGSLEVLPRGAWIPRPHRVSVRFGKPLRLSGEDYAALAREVERAVRG